MADSTRSRAKDDQTGGGTGEDGNSSSGGRHSKDAEPEQSSPWEWVVASLSVVMVLGAIGFILYEAVSEPASPPEIEITVGSITDTGSAYRVEFWAHNRGQTTAAGLAVEGELRSDTTRVETSSVTIQYVPGEARRRGGLFFSHDPRQYQLKVRPTGYGRP